MTVAVPAYSWEWSVLMADHDVSPANNRWNGSLVKGLVGGLATAVLTLLAVIGISWASGGPDPVDVHKVDKSPQDIRDVWTPENLEKAKQGNPMPVIPQD